MKTSNGYFLMFLSSSFILVLVTDLLYEGIKAQSSDVTSIDVIIRTYIWPVRSVRYKTISLFVYQSSECCGQRKRLKDR